MNKRNLLTISGFILFLLGFVGIVVNMVGLAFALTDWVSVITGPVFGFIFKVILIIAGIIMVIIAQDNNGEEGYDEYFDGKSL